MCLVIEVERPDRVLAKGVYEGFEWVVTHNDVGHRCGYVRVPLGHPWHGSTMDQADENIRVHGGITFTEPDVPCEKDGPDNAWWVGFDCAHAFDAPDLELLKNETKEVLQILKGISKGGVVRTQEYVEEECKNLCLQAKEAIFRKDKDGRSNIWKKKNT